MDFVVGIPKRAVKLSYYRKYSILEYSQGTPDMIGLNRELFSLLNYSEVDPRDVWMLELLWNA